MSDKNSGVELRLATVAAKNGTYWASLKFDGDDTASTKFYRSLVSVSVNNRVLCAKVSGTWVIINYFHS